MIIGIDKNRQVELINARKELYQRLALAIDDKSAIADYLDFFDTRCVPLAIKSLPGKLKKRYLAKQRDLMAGLESLKKKVGDDERKMYGQMNICANRFNKFVKTAYTGAESLSNEPLEYLFSAEFSSTIARLVYNELEQKYKEKYSITDEDEEQK